MSGAEGPLAGIGELVAGLPELYQPVFGHPEYDGQASRSCGDREARIVEMIRLVQETLGRRELRVLDIGCAQGYYSLVAAREGCRVTGIDYDAKNIALCRALAAENPGCAVDFHEGDFAQGFCERLDADSDLVFLFSVVHHVAQRDGFPQARRLVEQLGKRSRVVLLETALREEPLYWGPAQPEYYESWAEGFAFFDELDFFPTHLSGIMRPLLFCSNSLLYCDGRFFPFDEMHRKSFAGGMQPEGYFKRQYLSAELHAILVRNDVDGKEKPTGRAMREELENAVTILTGHAGRVSFFPELLAVARDARRMLAVTRIERGRLLYDILAAGEEVDCDRLVTDVLDQLVELEKAGLCHTDLRSWNVVLLADGRPRLIDVGAIRPAGTPDCASAWSRTGDVSLYQAFVAFVDSLYAGNLYSEIGRHGVYFLREAWFSTAVPARLQAWFHRILELPEEQTGFGRIRGLLVLASGDDINSEDPDATARLFARMAVFGEKLHALQMKDHLELEGMERRRAEAEGRARNWQERHVMMAAEKEHYESLYLSIAKSRSWRVTAPLRALFSALRRIALIGKAVILFPIWLLRFVGSRLGRKVLSRPGLKAFFKFLFQPFPGLQLRLKRLIASDVVTAREIIKLEQLSPAARIVYQDLKTVLAGKRNQ
jgi:SAM-dependent methyltransferase